MYEQHRIAQTLPSVEPMVRLQDLLAQAGCASRTEIGRRACRLFGFLDARGQP